MGKLVINSVVWKTSTEICGKVQWSDCFEHEDLDYLKCNVSDQSALFSLMESDQLSSVWISCSVFCQNVTVTNSNNVQKYQCQTKSWWHEWCCFNDCGSPCSLYLSLFFTFSLHQTLRHLRTAEFKPYVVFVKPPSIERLRETRRNAKVISGKDDKNSSKSFSVIHTTHSFDFNMSIYHPLSSWCDLFSLSISHCGF